MALDPANTDSLSAILTGQNYAANRLFCWVHLPASRTPTVALKEHTSGVRACRHRTVAGYRQWGLTCSRLHAQRGHCRDSLINKLHAIFGAVLMPS